MKKLITLSVAFLLALSLNSCSGSDGDGGSSSPIVGTWKYAGTIDFDGVDLETDLEDCDREIYKFSGNFKGKYTDRACGEPSESGNFEWDEFDANRFEIFDVNGDAVPFVFQVSEDGKQLYLFEEFVEGSSDNYGDVYTK